jgi:drug/metabolite transporter (DMT)-like permease
MLLFVSANKTTTSANAILLQYTGPIITAFIGAALLKERARLEHWIAFALVTGGMIVMFMDKLGGGQMLGNILAVLSAVAFSFYFVFMRMQKDGSPLESILLSHWIVAAIGITASVFLPMPTVTLKAVGAIAVLGLFQVGVSAILFAAAIKRISAVSANLIAVIEPVFNPIWVFLALGEAPGPKAVIGGLIIVVAVTGASIISAKRAIS